MLGLRGLRRAITVDFLHRGTAGPAGRSCQEFPAG
ncbi:hypothetical protein Ae505Ps2_2672 [Pseudonocardia sp. Ae505_Ps2]|nr:hypothetical protein Ae505Ps2_2672 [Pseudonocardia sp. Ae505_Ps2]